jgi:hypothetical protein
MPNINFQVTDSAKKARPAPGVTDRYVLEIDVMPPPEKYTAKDVKFGGKEYNVSAGPRKRDANKGYISFSSTGESYLPNDDYVFVTEINELYTKDDFNSDETQSKVTAAVKLAQKQPDLVIVAGALKELQDKIKTMSDANLDPAQQKIVNDIITYRAPTLANPPEEPDGEAPPAVSDTAAKTLLNLGPASDKNRTGVPVLIAEIAGKNDDFRNFMLLGREAPSQLTGVNAQTLHDNLMLMASDLGVDEKEINKMLDTIKGPDEESEADLTVSDPDFTAGQQQISAILRKIKKIVDNPGDAISIGDFPGRPDISALNTSALALAYSASEFNPDETYNDEIDAAIATVESNTADLASAQPFLARPGVQSRFVSADRSKSSNDEIAKILRDFGGPYFNHLLSQPDSAAALKLLKAGREGKLTNDNQNREYTNVLAFTALFGTKDRLEKMLDGATVNPDGSVSAPATGTSGSTGALTSGTGTGETSPTGAGGETGVATPGSPTGEVSAGTAAAGVGGGGTASPSAAGGAPGSAAPVNPIAIGVVQILNAQPAKISLSIEPANLKAEAVPMPVWEISPEYFSGYRLEINDTYRPFVELYKGSQALLKITATPITGGRPVQLSRPITIRPYILPKQLGEIPVTTFAVGRLMGGVTINPDPAQVGGAVDFDGRDGEVPCLYFKADGGAASAAGDNVSVRTTANGRTYAFTFTSGFLVPVRIKIDPNNKKQAAALSKIKEAQGIDQESMQESKRLIKEGGVPHWIFLKPGRKGRGGGAGAGGAGAGEDDSTAGGLAVNIGVRKIVISTDIKYRIVGNVGDPWDESSFKVELFSGTGASFPKAGEFPEAGIILCADDVRDLGLANMTGGIKDLKAAMFQVLFTMNSPSNTPYKRMGASRWVQDARVAGGNPNTSVTARERPRRLSFAT